VAFLIQGAEKNRLSLLGGGDTCQLVLFQVALGALLIDILVGCELRTDPKIRRGTSLDVLVMPKFNNPFRFLADSAIHG